ncbi:MAG: RCC1 domain-containing protein [Streptosporangiaceae bacterium]
MTVRFARGRGFKVAVPVAAAAGLVIAILAAGTPAATANSLREGTVLAPSSLRGGAVHYTGLTAQGYQAWHWGWYFGDQHQHNGDEQVSPVPMNLKASVVQVATSNSTDYALLSNGTVWAWGEGDNGELGNGSDSDSFTKAVQVQFPEGVQIEFLPTDAMPYDTGLAVDTDGYAWGWGYNAGGSLCKGDRRSYNEPVKLPFTDVTSLAGAYQHAVYDADGTLYSCGANTDGVLGDGGTQSSDSPVAVSKLNGQQVTELVSAWGDAGALLSNGTYWDWGYNNHGQLGDGERGAPSSVPMQVDLPDSSPVEQAAQGGSTPTNGQTIVQLQDGSLYAWGDDEDSQLGDGHTGDQVEPEQIFAPSGVSYADLATGGATSYAITANGKLYAWGYNGQGEIGNGTKRNATQPVLVNIEATLISATAGNVSVADPG